MFQAPKAPPAPPSAPVPVKEPGEFTRMFQASPSPAAAPPPAATKSNPSDFEQLFETRSPAGPMPHSPAVQQPLTPQSPGGSGPNRIGEFTQTFGKDRFDPAPAPPAAAPAPKEPGEFTRMFHSPGAAAQPPAQPAAQPAPVAPPATRGTAASRAAHCRAAKRPRRIHAPVFSACAAYLRARLRNPSRAAVPEPSSLRASRNGPARHAQHGASPHAAEEIKPGVDPRRRRNCRGDRAAGCVLRHASQIVTSRALAKS